MQSFAKRVNKKDWKEFKISEPLEDAVSFFEPILKDKGIVCTTNVDNDEVKIEGLPHKIETIFHILITNSKTAFKTIPSHQNKYISISISKNAGGMSEIVYKDNAGGMSKETLDQIYRPFFSTKNSTEVAGLGMFVCHEIVTEHFGNIEVCSNLGVGTTATITIPSLKKTLNPLDSDTPKKSVSINKMEHHFTDDYYFSKETEEVNAPSILLVDDDATVCKVLMEVLVDYNIKAYTNPVKVLEKEDFDSFNAAIIDLKMPDISGLDLLRQIQDQTHTLDRKSTRLNSSHSQQSRMPSSA